MHDTKGLLDLPDGLLELVIFNLDKTKDKARFTSCAKALHERVTGLWGEVTYRAKWGFRDTEAQIAAKRAKTQVFIDWCLKYAHVLKVLRVAFRTYASREQQTELLAIIQQNHLSLQELQIDLRRLTIDDLGAFIMQFSLLKKLTLEIGSFREANSSILQHPSLEELKLTVGEDDEDPSQSWRLKGVFKLPTDVRKMSINTDADSVARLLGISEDDTAPPHLHAELQQLQTYGYNDYHDVWLLDALASLSSMTFLDLSHASFEFVPSDIGVLTSLQKLDLSRVNIYTQAQDPLSFLKTLKQLTHLKARNVQVNEKAITTVPPAFQHYRNLQCLDLSYNNLQADNVLVQLTSLTSLDVSYNKHLKLKLGDDDDELASRGPLFGLLQRPLVPSPFPSLQRLAVNHTDLKAPQIAVLSQTVKLLQVSQDQIGWHCRVLLGPSSVPLLEELRIKDDNWEEYFTAIDEYSEPEFVTTEEWPWYETPLSSFDGEQGLLHYCEKLPALKTLLVANGKREGDQYRHDDCDESQANIAAIVKSTYSFARNRPDVNFKIVDDKKDSGFDF